METAVVSKGEMKSPLVARVEEGWLGKVKDFVSVDRRIQKKLDQYSTLLDTLPPNVSAEERVRIAINLVKRARNVAVVSMVMDGLAAGGIVVLGVLGVKAVKERAHIIKFARKNFSADKPLGKMARSGVRAGKEVGKVTVNATSAMAERTINTRTAPVRFAQKLSHILSGHGEDLPEILGHSGAVKLPRVDSGWIRFVARAKTAPPSSPRKTIWQIIDRGLGWLGENG